jgi:hypothetical protein
MYLIGIISLSFSQYYFLLFKNALKDNTKYILKAYKYSIQNKMKEDSVTTLKIKFYFVNILI